MPKLNVLVIPGGTEIGLEINRALRDVKDIQLFSANSDVANHASFVFNRHFVVPDYRHPDFVPSLNRVIEETKIDYVYPAHDDILTFLAGSDEIMAKAVVSPAETCNIARSKSATYAALAGVVPIPKRYMSYRDVTNYPVFGKPDASQGSYNVRRLYSDADVISYVEKAENGLILEFLPGEEFTVDCFSDRDAGLLHCLGRKRIRMRSGISVTTEREDRPEFAKYAAAINGKLRFHGAWFFQLKEDADGALKLLEIAPRIAGAMAYDRVLGVNLPLLSIYEQERIPLRLTQLSADVYMDRALVNRYRHNVSYDDVFFDLDDTLIVNGHVNTAMMAFLFGCLNKGKKVVLLTKHAGDLTETLSKYRLAGLFDRVVHLTRDQRKADHMNPGSILIDDSFAERMQAVEAGFAAFDNSMIELLMDDRV